MPKQADFVYLIYLFTRADPNTLNIKLPFYLEGDSEVVINALKSDESSLASFGHLIDSMKQSLEASTHICFLHTLKLDNLTAHSSAKTYQKFIDINEECFSTPSVTIL